MNCNFDLLRFSGGSGGGGGKSKAKSGGKAKAKTKPAAKKTGIRRTTNRANRKKATA